MIRQYFTGHFGQLEARGHGVVCAAAEAAAAVAAMHYRTRYGNSAPSIHFPGEWGLCIRSLITTGIWISPIGCVQ